MNRQSYFLEQLFTIGVAGVYGVLMVVRFFETVSATEHTFLSTIKPWIQYLVLGGSIVLLAQVLLRALGVWAATANVNGRDHHHHDHEHPHDHGPDHGHGHDHDHGWSPWRYAVLLFPLMLLALPGWPDRIQNFITGKSKTAAVAIGADNELLAGFGFLALSQPDKGWSGPLGPVVAALAVAGSADEVISTVEDKLGAERKELDFFTRLTDEQRQAWKGRRIETEGLYGPLDAQGRTFQIFRLRMACCLTDARPARIYCAIERKPGASKQPDKRPANNQWIRVKGRIDFAVIEGKWQPVLRVSRIDTAPEIKVPPPAQQYLN